MRELTHGDFTNKLREGARRIRAGQRQELLRVEFRDPGGYQEGEKELAPPAISAQCLPAAPPTSTVNWVKEFRCRCCARQSNGARPVSDQLLEVTDISASLPPWVGRRIRPSGAGQP